MLETRPLRRYVVTLSPQDAVQAVFSKWTNAGCQIDPWNLDGAVRSCGEWTGVILRTGSIAKSFLAEMLVEACPLALPIPLVTNQRGRLRIAIIARPCENSGVSEIFLFHFDSSVTAGWIRPEELSRKMMEELQGTFIDCGCLVSGPQMVKQKLLPDSHPFSYKQWHSLKKEMRRSAKR